MIDHRLEGALADPVRGINLGASTEPNDPRKFHRPERARPAALVPGRFRHVVTAFTNLDPAFNRDLGPLRTPWPGAFGGSLYPHWVHRRTDGSYGSDSISRR